MVAFPVIPYNATTGSDTAPSDSDGSGTNGDLATTTLTLNETVDFTGVADDDSDYLWYEGNAGDRHLFQVTAFNPSVAACTSLTVSPSGTTRTAKNWYVNGTRKTLKNDTSRYDWQDHALYWQAEFDAGTYDVPNIVNFAWQFYAGLRYPPNAWFAKSGAASRPVIDISGTSQFAYAGNDVMAVFQGLKFTTSGAGDKQSIGFSIQRSGCMTIFDDCVFDFSGATGGNRAWFYIQQGSTDSAMMIRNCYFEKATERDAVLFSSGHSMLHFWGNTMAGTEATASYYALNVAAGNVDCQHNLFRDSGWHGIFWRSQDGMSGSFRNNTFADNGGSGIVLDEQGTSGSVIVENNIFAFNTRYGIEHLDTYQTQKNNKMLLTDYNAYYSNTSGERLNLDAGANDVTLTADPFTSRGDDDYTLNNTAGGGAACKAAGFPGAFPDGT
jgi:hypothetical protein